jgi:hypothetical protein
MIVVLSLIFSLGPIVHNGRKAEPKKLTILTICSMKEIIEKILTERATRNSKAIVAIAANQEEFDTWN